MAEDGLYNPYPTEVVPQSTIQSGKGGQDQDDDGERLPLLGAGGAIKVYRRRWYLLLLFALVGFVQNMVWNTWGPITDSVALVFGWSNGDIAMFANVGNVLFAIMAFPSSWMLDVLGLRVSALVVAVLNAIATGIRCITSDDTFMYWSSTLAAVLSGATGPIISASPALFSSSWFPAHQRTFATGTLNFAMYGGIATSMVIGPQIVHYVNPFAPNMTTTATPTEASVGYSDDFDDLGLHRHHHHNHTGNPIVEKQREEIMLLMYLEFALAGFLCLLTILYFPARPPLPPSSSASLPRVNFKWAFKKLFSSSQFWLIMLANALPGGIIVSWVNILDISLKRIGIDQTEAGWMGFYQMIAGAVLGVIVAIISDKFSRHNKLIIVVLSVLSGLAFVWVLLLRNGYIRFSLVEMYIAVIAAGAFVTAENTIFYELASEKFYPIAEGIIGGSLVITYNITSVLFLLIFYIPNIGVEWVIPTMLVASVTAIPFILGVKESYGRLALDSADPIKSRATEDEIQ